MNTVPNTRDYKYKIDGKTRIDRSQNQYDWKVGASLVNLGFVNFDKPGVTRRMEIGTQTAQVDWNDFDEADRWNEAQDVDSFAASFFSGEKIDSSFRMYTPASLNLSGDFQLKDNFYLGAMYQQSLMSYKAKGPRTPTMLTVVPRYETRWFTASMPLSFARYYNKVNIGAYVRAGIFYVGTDNLGGVWTGQKTNGYNLYAGFNWPIHYSKIPDRDGDGVSDGEDECPDVVGTRSTDGCPDEDGDKVADSEDLCPSEPGTKRTKGCPDPDEDGLAGADDLCPDAFGDKNSQGCPDSDGDGVHDGIDECPEQAGEEDFAGCPEIILDTIPTHVDPPLMYDTDTAKKTDPVVTTPTETAFNKFDDWDFENYEYWPVLGAYNDIRWANELKQRLENNLGVQATIKTIPGVSKYYITLGKAVNQAEAQKIQDTLDLPRVNQELNGKVWWKKVLGRFEKM